MPGVHPGLCKLPVLRPSYVQPTPGCMLFHFLQARAAGVRPLKQPRAPQAALRRARLPPETERLQQLLMQRLRRHGAFHAEASCALRGLRAMSMVHCRMQPGEHSHNCPNPLEQVCLRHRFQPDHSCPGKPQQLQKRRNGWLSAGQWMAVVAVTAVLAVVGPRVRRMAARRRAKQ